MANRQRKPSKASNPHLPFIQLTMAAGDPVWVNEQHVVSIYPYQEPSTGEKPLVCVETVKARLLVQETVTAIIALLLKGVIDA